MPITGSKPKRTAGSISKAAVGKSRHGRGYAASFIDGKAEMIWGTSLEYGQPLPSGRVIPPCSTHLVAKHGASCNNIEAPGWHKETWHDPREQRRQGCHRVTVQPRAVGHTRRPSLRYGFKHTRTNTMRRGPVERVFSTNACSGGSGKLDLDIRPGFDKGLTTPYDSLLGKLGKHCKNLLGKTCQTAKQRGKRDLSIFIRMSPI
ncbi:hypothetical protein CLAIMM_07193 [Cladophialophora immunda]|nr:hypothetical protein CLAIMM_07193 [Cladophialophora immunda]